MTKKILGRTTLKTAHSDLDSFGHVNNAHYLRYCEQARLDLFGKLLNGIEDMYQYGILIVATGVRARFLLPLGHSRTIQITTRQVEARRLKGTFEHAIREKNQDGNPVAFACQFDWGLIPVAGSWKKVDPKALAGLRKRMERLTQGKLFPFPGGLLNAGPPADMKKIPEKDRPRPVVYETRAEPWQMDSLGHANNAFFASYLECGRWAFFRELGMRMDREALGLMGMEASRDEGQFILSRMSLDFTRPVLIFEPLRVLTWLTDLRPGRFYLYQEVRGEDGTLFCRSRSEASYIRASTGRPGRMPEDFRRRAGALLAGEGLSSS